MSNKLPTLYFTTLLILMVLSGNAQRVSPEEINIELNKIQQRFAPDKRVVVFNIYLQDTNLQQPLLKGETNSVLAKKALCEFFEARNIAFTDSVRLLPDQAVGEKQWGLVNLSVANMRAAPDHASELVTQALMSTPLKILDYNGKWYRVQTPDYYIGWMDSSGLRTFNETEITVWKNANRYVFNKLTGYGYNKPSTNADIVTDLVKSDIFVVLAKARGFLKIQLPDGRIAYVNAKDCISFTDWVKQVPEPSAILKMAASMMGSPYLWGGTSVKGCDCSGLIKQAYYASAIILARDASQQACYGDPVDISNMQNFKPADLLFFGNSPQRITHVGLNIGNQQFIHCSGKVHISSLNPNDANYHHKRNLVSARRILNAKNGDGIVPVKNHLWYINLNN